MTRWLITIVLFIMATISAEAAAVPEMVLKAQRERVAVVKRARATVLAIFGAKESSSGGSGVVISPDGYALTNFHVANPAGHHMRCGMVDGRLYDAVIVSVDPTGDVALIKLFPPEDDKDYKDYKFPCAELADSDKVRAGDWSLAIGNPFLLATDFRPTVSFGMISGVHRYQYPAGTLLEYADCLQTDAAINPGNSGGPLFDAQGRVIGIIGRGSFEKRGRVNVGVGYAISINQIKNFLGYLRSGRIVDHATLGATVATAADGAVVVTDLLEDSDAYRRGLRYDDEIVRFGGRPIHTVNGLKNALGIYPKGWRLPLSYRREGQTYDVLVRLRGVHRSGELWARADASGLAPEKKPGAPEKKPEKTPPKPDRPKRPKLFAHSSTPKVVRDHYEKRTGYANYYFNRLHRDRVWKNHSSHGEFSKLSGRWILAGELSDGDDCEFRLDDAQAIAILPGGQSTEDTRGDLSRAIKPTGSGGLLAALHCWRRLLMVGPERFGRVDYLGTRPLAGHASHVDVLVGINEGVECHFLFDPDKGYLVAMEMFGSEDRDPCEIYFSEYKATRGRELPHRLEVRSGDRTFGLFEIVQWEFEE